MAPHVDIHRGSDEQFCLGGQHDCGDEVVGDAVIHLGKRVGGCGRDHHEVGPVGDRDMVDLAAIRIEQIVAGRMLTQCFEHQRGNELRGFSGEHATADVPCGCQSADQLRDLVGSDPTGHGNYDSP